jgi:hypothetical protein
MTSPLRLDAPHLLAAGMALIDQSFGIAMLGCFLASVLLGSAVLLSGGPPCPGCGAPRWASPAPSVHLWRRRNPARVTGRCPGLRPVDDRAADRARRACGAWPAVYMDLESPQSVVSALA